MVQATQNNLERLDDRQLIQRFHQMQDERAFALLVERHGAMVLRVCRKILLTEQDAEDVYQAVFMVLARKAGSVRWQKCLANWLYGVAIRLSLKANNQMLKRPRSLELKSDLADELSESGNQQAELSAEAERVLYEEIERLPRQLKGPILLCSLEGKTRQQAADALGLKISTIKGRLERARNVLHARMLKREIVLPAALLTSGLIPKLAEAGFSTKLIFSPVKVASKLTLDVSVQGKMGATAIKLAQGELAKMLMITQAKIVVVTIAVALFVGGGSLLVLQSSAGEDEKVKTTNSIEPAKKPLSKIHKQLIGEWKIISVEDGGRVMPAERIKTAKLIITPSHWTLTEGEIKPGEKYSLDLSKKPYAVTMDNKKIRGIFELKDNKLKLCFNEQPDGERPNQFISVAGQSPNDLYIIAKRIKPKK